MHEFSLCQSVIKIVSDQLIKKKYKSTNKINKVILSIGEIAGVDIESIRFWFPVVAKDTLLEKAQLEVKLKEGKALCLRCNYVYRLFKLYQACPNCESYEKHILSGQEMLVKNIEMSN